MSRSNQYNKSFYQAQQDGSLRSAEGIVPLIIKLINPRSVIDVGCGVGTWLSVFKKLGVDDIFGVDGKWVQKEMLKIPEKQFLEFDLSKPLKLDRQFDLVISLEVAEHLSSEYAGQFVESLTGLGAVVAFSAAIPYQGGTEHINEQWPDYWVNLFERQGYKVIDCLRKHIWNNGEVQYWYAQNLLIFVKDNILKNNQLLREEFNNTKIGMLSLVHPKHYLLSLDTSNLTLKQVLVALPKIISKSIIFRLKKYLRRLANQ
jgi:2-polyprenyl-3-methyl-5-hydroxy-6-metoxy-1,4-benzoquinol methylase